MLKYSSGHFIGQPAMAGDSTKIGVRHRGIVSNGYSRWFGRSNSNVSPRVTPDVLRWWLADILLYKFHRKKLKGVQLYDLVVGIFFPESASLLAKDKGYNQREVSIKTVDVSGMPEP